MKRLVIAFGRGLAGIQLPARGRAEPAAYPGRARRHRTSGVRLAGRPDPRVEAEHVGRDNAVAARDL